MLDPERAIEMLAEADQIWCAEEVDAAVRRVAKEIQAAVGHAHPLLLSVMGGAVVFTGQILPLLTFPLDFDTIHVSRYGKGIGGGKIEWKLGPRENVAGRVVLVLDDILDEGETMAAIRDEVLRMGAAEFRCAVLADKALGRAKPVHADFIGLSVPDRYVFGYGMDAYGKWRNLPAIYALARKS